MNDLDLRVEVVEIKEIAAMEGVDRIELAWLYREAPHGEPCIVGKDQFVAGQHVVYFPPEHIVPDVKEFAFLERHPELVGDGEKFIRLKHRRIKPMKMRGYISHGLVLSMDEANRVALVVKGDGLGELPVGSLIGDKLGVGRWEPKMSGGQGLSGSQSSPQCRPKGVDVPKYDLTGIRKLGDIFEWEGRKSAFSLVLSEKLHGCGSRFVVLRKKSGILSRMWRKIKSVFCDSERTNPLFEDKHFRLYVSSRKVWRGVGPKDASIWKEVAEKQGLFAKLRKFPGIAIYGEIIGQRAQGQSFRYGVPPDVVDFRMFDAYEPARRMWCGWDVIEVLAATMGLRLVPILATGQMSRETADKYVDGVSTLSKNTMREGIVVRTFREAKTPRGGRMIVKMKSEAFIQKHG